MEVIEHITTSKASVISDWNRDGPEITIQPASGAKITLCFDNEETMRTFGVAVGALCNQPDSPGLIHLSRVKKMKETNEG